MEMHLSKKNSMRFVRSVNFSVLWLYTVQAAQLFFADLLRSINQQPQRACQKPNGCQKLNQQKNGFAGESTKICILAGAELIKRHA